MMDLLEFSYGRYTGGSTVPAGSYFNPRTMCIFQTTSDAVLPQDGIFCRVDPSGSQTFANIAAALNALLGTSYTAASFHTCGGTDATPQPGQGANDA